MTPEGRQLEQALIQLGRMYEALAHLRERTGGRGQYFVLSEGPLDEIRRLESTIADLSGRTLIEAREADVWMRVSSARLDLPEAPTSILTNLLDALRKGVQVAAEWLLKGEVSTRPTQELKKACDLRVLALEPGSVRVALRLPEPESPAEGDMTAAAVRDAFAKYLAVAAWAGSAAPDDVLAERVGDSDLRRILLNEVKRLVPRPRGDVESVELYGRGIPELARVRLTRELHERIDSAIDRAERETIESYEGDLREIDLDNLTLTLRNVGGAVYQVACEFGPDLYDTALDALGRRVEVSGVRRLEKGRGRAGRLRVTRLVILDEGGDGRSADPAG